MTATKRADRARRRAARYADRGRRAAGPAERHDAARGYLLAAVKHAPAADQQARHLAADYDQVVRDLVEASGLQGDRGRLFHDQLGMRREPRARLAQTLRLLRAAADHHPQADRVHAFYADLLTEQARRIDAHHLRGGDRG